MKQTIMVRCAIICVLTASVAWAQGTGKQTSADLAGIQRLHEQDIQATLSGKADDLAKLWTEEAVRMEPGGLAEVGLKAIYAHDKREETSSPGAQTLTYKPDIRDIQIVNDWAFEWGYFESAYKVSADAKPETLNGKLLRVLRRQPDGSWKFARVMWNKAN